MSWTFSFCYLFVNFRNGQIIFVKISMHKAMNKIIKLVLFVRSHLFAVVGRLQLYRSDVGQVK